MIRLLGAFIAAACIANPAHAACSGPRQEYDYPVVMRGVPQLIGYRAVNIMAFAPDGKGGWARIPSQVDEVNAHGDYVLSNGMPFTARTDDGVLDGNDELVLSGVNLGDAFKDEDVPKWIDDLAAQRWKVEFCRDQTFVGAAVVIAARKAEPWNGKQAAIFFDQAGQVETERYVYKFRKDHPVLLGEVGIKTDKGPIPVIDSSRFLMPLETPFFMPDMEFDQDDFSSQVECWQTGPIRAIVAVGVKYKSFLSLFKLHLFSELVFYRNKFEIPTVIEFVFDPTRFLKPGSGLAYSLTFPKEHGWEVDANLVPLPLQDAGDVIEHGPRANTVPYFYATGRRTDGAFLVRVKVDPKATAQVPPPFLIRKDDFTNEKLAKYWPWLSEIPGDLGMFLDFSRIGQGIYEFGLDLLLSSKANDRFTDYGLLDIHWTRLPARK